MGWSTGSCLMSNIIRSSLIRSKPFNVKYDLFVVLIETFEAEDCDTLEDCVGMDEAFDAAYRDMTDADDPYEDDLYEDDDEWYEDDYEDDDEDFDDEYEDDFGGFYVEDDYDPIDTDNFF